MAPQMTDLNRQSDSLLPEISITNKKLTQVVSTVVKKDKMKQFVLKPRLGAVTEQKRMDIDTHTEGVETDGGSVGHNRVLRSTESAASKESSQGGLQVLRDGQLTLGQKRRIYEQLTSSGQRVARQPPLTNMPAM